MALLHVIKKNYLHMALYTIIGFSLFIQLAVIFSYGSKLTLGSDDLGYIKTAGIMSQSGRFVFQDVNEPTVYGTPLYPLFIAGIFQVTGPTLLGVQIVRVIQVLLSGVTLYYLYLIGKKLFDEKIALLAVLLCGVYTPFIISQGYIITESLFIPLLFAIIYQSLRMMDALTVKNTVILGVLWAVTTLCRPTISLFPIMLYACLLFFCRYPVKDLFKTGILMIVTFCVIMSPWWVRNFIQYGEFIPVGASDGNPMLQGTYIGYKQTPQNITPYKLGKNYYETNKIEVQVAKKRMREGFRSNFWAYLKWYTIDKIRLMWVYPFYWQKIFDISANFVVKQHNLILMGFCGIISALLLNFKKYFYIASFPIYFTAVHCIFMTFDRYAFPVTPILALFSSFFMIQVSRSLSGMILPNKHAKCPDKG